ncbi:MOSC domain-containing protein [Amaricoccus solimangrovi]|uniref:Sulfurase n=1 Tax=Amaricoccus solimangrovi TaxID=2589815 RepID=A0A501WVK5_9RHOB|nr:MOSC domain-containing protein [Amaricoccus solimangrovi]TPE53793.1 sulfurase [Amaricoccus solimangrovi]
MAILNPTDLAGRVVFLGVVPDRALSLRSVALERARARFDGLEGESHGGLTRASCSRVGQQYPKGTTIRNTRQISILSREEIAATASAIGLAELDPRLLGANIVFEGLPELTLLPPSSRLIFESGASLVIDMENGPCAFPAKEIEAEHPGHGVRWKSAAMGRRGVTAWVEAEGEIALHAIASLHCPPIRLYPPLS